MIIGMRSFTGQRKRESGELLLHCSNLSHNRQLPASAAVRSTFTFWA
jgi:hypothetical protein